MTCFPPAPINPISEVILGAFGDNFFPPYNTGFQPTKRSDMTNETLLKLSQPGGGKLKPIGEPDQRHISEILSPVAGLLGAVFSFFAPLYIILDLIRALIDIICSFFNPAPLISSVLDLFLNVVPPAIALYPPLSSILHALNTAKVVTAIVASTTSSIMPIIDLLVENALTIPDLIADGNPAAAEAVATKICILLETFANELGGFAPISFIIELLELFLNLGSKFFCVSDSVCCTPEVCPPIIFDPPSGTGEIVYLTIPGVTINDLLDLTGLRAVDFDSLFDLPITILDPAVDILTPPVSIPLSTIPLSTLTGGLVEDLEDIELGPYTLGPYSIGPFGPVDLFGVIPDYITDIKILAPNMTLQFTNPPSNIGDLKNYIVHPDDIPTPVGDGGTVPATIRFKIRRTDLADQPYFTVAATSYGPLPFTIDLGGSSVDVTDFFNIEPFVTLYTDIFPAGTPVEWEMIPDREELLKLSLIGLGCDDDVREVGAGLQLLINETQVGIQAVSGGDDRSGFEPLANKLGRGFPAIPTEEYNACLAKQTADPTVSQAQCVFDISQAYLDELLDFALDLVCLGSSRVVSEFEVSKPYVQADGQDFATITLTVKDAGGTNLLEDFIPTARVPEDINAQFDSTFGEVGPVIFDTETAQFRANITSNSRGVAQISGAFLVKSVLCMVPGSFDGFTIEDKVLEVEFVRPGGTYPRRRRRPPYVQSAGGRRR